MDIPSPEGGTWGLGGISYTGPQVGEHPGYDTQTGAWQWGVDILSIPFKPWLIPKVGGEAIETGIETTTGIDPGDVKETLSMGLVGLALVAAILLLWKS